MSAGSPSVPNSLVLVAAVAALALVAAPARACDVAITRAPGDVILRYDPFGVENAPAELAVTVRNRGSEPCAFDLALLDAHRSPQRRLVLAPSGFEVEVRTAGGDAPLAQAAEPGVWRATAAAGAERDYRLTVAVVKDGVPPAGRTDFALGLELREAGGAAPLAPATPVLLAIESPPRAQLNIAGATGYFGAAPGISTVDLGVLAPGLTKRLFLQVRANIPATRLTILSENKGLLLPLREDVRSEATAIPYHVVLVDEAIDLRQPAERPVAAPLSLAGQSLPFDIVVGDFRGRPAGAYSDVLTVEISAL